MEIFVGLSAFRGSIRRFGFDLLELAVGATLPRPKVLAEYREARPDVAFSFRLHPDLLTPGAAPTDDVARTILAAEAAQAHAVVVPTGPRFSPTTSNRKRLGELADRLRPATAHIAWEPRGVFSSGEAEGWAEELGLLLVRDLTREEPAKGPIVYTRLLPLGFGARVTHSALEQLMERLDGIERAYVVVLGEGAKGARAQLREALGLEEA